MAERPRRRPSKPDTRVRIPLPAPSQGSRLAAGRRSLEPATRVRVPPPLPPSRRDRSTGRTPDSDSGDDRVRLPLPLSPSRRRSSAVEQPLCKRQGASSNLAAGSSSDPWSSGPGQPAHNRQDLRSNRSGSTHRHSGVAQWQSTWLLTRRGASPPAGSIPAPGAHRAACWPGQPPAATRRGPSSTLGRSSIFTASSSSGQDTGLSLRKRGFDSRRGHHAPWDFR